MKLKKKNNEVKINKKFYINIKEVSSPQTKRKQFRVCIFSSKHLKAINTCFTLAN